jgi:hypothetical protein
MSGYEDGILSWSEEQAALLRRRAAGERVNASDRCCFDSSPVTPPSVWVIRTPEAAPPSSLIKNSAAGKVPENI